VLRRGGADQDGAGERDRASGHQRSREALAEHDAGEERDKEGPEVDEHRRGARVDVALRVVQRDVVQRKPEHAAEGDCGHVPRGRQRLAPHCDHEAERDAREREAPEREGLRRQLARSGANGDEGRRPQRDRDQGRPERAHAWSNGAGSRRVRRQE